MKTFLTHIDGVRIPKTELSKSKELKEVSQQELIKKLGNCYVDGFGYNVWDILTVEGEFYRIYSYFGKIYVYYDNDFQTIDKTILGINVKPTGEIPVASVQVKSFSNKNKKYFVQIYENKKFSCTCPDYVYNEYHECKHIKRVKAKLLELEEIR